MHRYSYTNTLPWATRSSIHPDRGSRVELCTGRAAQRHGPLRARSGLKIFFRNRAGVGRAGPGRVVTEPGRFA